MNQNMLILDDISIYSMFFLYMQKDMHTNMDKFLNPVHPS